MIAELITNYILIGAAYVVGRRTGEGWEGKRIGPLHTVAFYIIASLSWPWLVVEEARFQYKLRMRHVALLEAINKVNAAINDAVKANYAAKKAAEDAKLANGDVSRLN